MTTPQNRDWHCWSCRHLDRTSDAAAPTCKAFPEGIPIQIQFGSVLHDDPLPGDHGIQYEPATDHRKPG